MAKIVRYNGNLVPFASSSLGTERTIFGQVTQANDITSQFTAEFLRGWGIVGPSDQPTLQDFNAVSYTHGQILSYLHQVGVAEYNATQEYHIGSFCNSSSLLYVSLVNSNIGNTPSSSPASWKLYSSGQLINVRAFSTPGATVYTPSAGTKFIRVRLSGGGGAGGGAPATGAGVASLGGAGSAGSYAEALILSGFSGLTITVGSGGVGAPGGVGTNGGSSSLGGLVVAPGGISGTSAPSLTSAIQSGAVQPGTPSGGNILSTRGNRGGPGIVLSPTVGVAGNGGIGLFGTSVANGGDGQYNAPSTAVQVGNNGAPGIVIIEEYS